MLRARPCSSARISYSRDLTNLSTSSSPCLKALEEVCEASVRASRILAPGSNRGRLLACGLDEEDCLGGSLRFWPCWPAEGGGPLGGMFEGLCWSYLWKLGWKLPFACEEGKCLRSAFPRLQAKNGFRCRMSLKRKAKSRFQ